MVPGRWIGFVGVLAVLTAGLAVPTLGFLGVFDTEVWTRENPLAEPIAVLEVRDGAFRLSDGRTLRPAGVARRPGVPEGEFDDALRAISAQGVVVTRDLQDGTALFLAEPRFYNPCGTRGFGGNPWAHAAGIYLQCPVSELLIGTGHAIPVLEQPTLTNPDRWRLEGVHHAMDLPERPVFVSKQSTSLRFDTRVCCFRNYEGLLESVWRSPPGE